MKVYFSLGLLSFVMTLASCSGASTCSNPSGISFPFDYAKEGSYLWLSSGSDGSEKLRLSLGPFGGHAPMFTGHYVGNMKQDLQGHYAANRAEMTVLEDTNDNGVCDENEVCGIPEEQLLERAPVYRVPNNITNAAVTSVKLENIYSAGMYYGGLSHWSIQIEVCDMTFVYTHLRKVSESLRQKLVSAGAPDPETYTTVNGNIASGLDITVSEGDLLGYPQIVATEVSEHSDYYIGGGGTPDVPWAQMEFFHRIGDVTQSYYKLLSSSERNLLKNQLEGEISDPASFRYAEYYQDPRYTWLLAAEAVLETADSAFIDDYSSLLSNLGGWIEDSSGCSTNQPLCNEALAIFPIAKSSGLYSQSLYASSDVSYLLYYKDRSADYPNNDRWGEILNPYTLDPLSGVLTIGWHGIQGEQPNAVVTRYQSIRYLLSDDQLKVKWGEEADALAGLFTPSEIGSASCNGTSLTCHTHRSRGD